MLKIHFIKVALTVTIRVSEDVLEQRMAASPSFVGDELARQVQGYVKKHGLGYYPALDYFQGLDAIEEDLVETTQGIAWVVSELVRSEVISRLRPAFSRVEIEGMQSTAYMMPTVRPNHPNALYELAQHYTPDQVKITLLVSSIEKSANTKGLDKLAEHKVRRWLDQHFDTVMVTSSNVIHAD